MGGEAKDWKFKTGWVLTGLIGLALIASGAMKIMHSPQFLEGWAKFGYPASLAPTIGAIEIACAILLLVPRTAVLGAALVATYLGGATATHVRIGDPSFVGAVLFGVLAWGGIWLRDARLRELLPLRT